MKPRFSIFTPTYNRGYILNNHYLSLRRQSFTDFEWIIVDDGSEDETKQLIQAWKRECKEFKIIYKWVKNGGKPRAINIGVNLAKGKYFLIVDSDDYLKDDALEKMNCWCSEIDNLNDFIGVGAAKGYPNGRYLKNIPNVNEKGYVDATNLERDKYNLDVDMCEAYKLNIFKEFPMATWPGEKFAPEQIALNDIALAGYKIRWHKDIIYICEYLEDGLTKGSKKLEKLNPMGYAMMYNHKLLYDIPKREKLHAACQHIALSIYGGHLNYILKSNNLLYTIYMFPFGLILSIRRAIQYRSIKNA